LQHHLHLSILSFILAEILSSPVAFISFNNSSEFPKSAFVMLCVCVCVCVCVKIYQLWHYGMKKSKSFPANFRKLFPCLIAWIFTLRYWPFKMHKNSLPEADNYP
jgi:hypothetical protein